MINPLRRVIINGIEYNFDPASYKEGIPLKNSLVTTQSSRTFSGVQGKDAESFTMTVNLENTYEIPGGSMGQTSWLGGVGSTTWLGVSQLYHLKLVLGAQGVSMPIKFVTPYGMTYDVVPMGSLDVDTFNRDNPQAESMEYRVSLTLESIQ